MKIIFFGTPLFAANHLKALVDHKADIVAIITRQDSPQGRSAKLIAPPVKEMAKKLLPNIPILQPQKCSTPEFASLLSQFRADLFVIVAYGEIIKQFVLDLPPLGAINVHASLLPAYRGAAPMRHVLMDGKKETGVSVIKVTAQMDAGDILHVEKMALDDSITYGELEEKMADLGCKALIKVVDDFKNKTVLAVPQNQTLATLAPKITSEMCKLNWEKTSLQNHNLVRALSPEPGAWCEIIDKGEKRRLKVLRSEYEKDVHFIPKGLYQKGTHSLGIACREGILWWKTVQLEGKAPMAIGEFLKGHKKEALTVV